MAAEKDDQQLLEEYAGRRSQEAFAVLVRRHLSLVYYTALRRVGGDCHLAQDVAQSVFIALAKKAEAMKSHPALASWLFTSARYAAAQTVRTEQRRREREQKAHTMQTLSEPVSPDNWEQLAPLLDDAVEGLGARDRELVLLRYREGRSFVEIALRYGMTADAVRRRVERSLEKMRVVLLKRGVVSTAAALAGVMAAQSAQAAPTELASAIIADVFTHVGSAATLGAGAKAAATIAAWKVAACVAVIALGAGAIVVREHSFRRPPARPSVQASEQPQATNRSVALATAPVRAQNAPDSPMLRVVGYMPADRQLERLEALITNLTPEQRQQAFQIFQQLADAMNSLPQADRLTKGMQSRQDFREAIRSLLNPGQRAIYDAAPQIQGGGSSKPTAAMVARNAAIRTSVNAFVRGSSDVAAAVGAVRTVRSLRSAETGQNVNGSAAESYGGVSIVLVVGDRGRKDFLVSWRGQGNAVQVTKIQPVDQ